MHVLVKLVALLSLAWHTSGYAVDHAATSFEYEDVEHVDPNPTPDGKNPTEEIKLFNINNMTEDIIEAFLLFFYGEKNCYDSFRSKRSVPETKIDEIGTTEHIVIPVDRVHTINDERDFDETGEFEQSDIVKKSIENEEYPHRTAELQKAVDTAKLTTIDEEDTHEIDELPKAVDTAMQNINDGKDLHQTDELQKAEVTNDNKFVKEDTSDHEMKEEDDKEHKSEKFESIERELEEIDALLMLEELFWTEEDEESEGLEGIERFVRNSEWLGPIYPDYSWYPYWCPLNYPWGLYPGWSPYYFNPYPVAFPVNGGSFNTGGSVGGTAKQYVPVKGKVTIAASFTDGTWTLPLSRSVPNACFYPQNDCGMPVYGNILDAIDLNKGVRNEPIAKGGSGPYVSCGAIPVSGKVNIAAHFC